MTSNLSVTVRLTKIKHSLFIRSQGGRDKADTGALPKSTRVKQAKQSSSLKPKKFTVPEIEGAKAAPPWTNWPTLTYMQKKLVIAVRLGVSCVYATGPCRTARGAKKVIATWP